MRHGVAMKGIEGFAGTQRPVTDFVGTSGRSAGGMSLFAEYAMMLMTVHAVFCGLMRIAILMTYPLTISVAVVGITASVWIALRTSCVVPVRWFCPIVTLIIAAAVSQWGGLPSQPGTPESTRSLFSGAVFSSFALLSMLCVIMCGDVAELTRHVVLESQWWSRCREFLFRHGLRLLVYGIGGMMAVYAFLVPVTQEWLFRLQPAASNPDIVMDRLTMSQNMLFKLCESGCGMWFFVVGTCVGSFLNVVIYRVPAGLSVVTNASHCPGCQQAIWGRDNLPLIGWLSLQGKCRNCQIAISSRYPAVELTIGLMFLLLYFVELISGGTNLPGRAPNHYAGVLWILFYTKWDLVGLYAFHCIVLCALFSWAMIRRDGHPVPLKSVAITLAVVISVVLLQPHLLPWAHELPVPDQLFSLPAAAGPMGLGILTASLVHGALTVAQRFGESLVHSQFPSWLLIGVAFGWQTIVGILLLLTVWKLVQLASQLMSRHHDASSEIPGFIAESVWLQLPAAVLIHHCLWRQLVSGFDGWVVS